MQNAELSGTPTSQGVKACFSAPWTRAEPRSGFRSSDLLARMRAANCWPVKRSMVIDRLQKYQ